MTICDKSHTFHHFPNITSNKKYLHKTEMIFFFKFIFYSKEGSFFEGLLNCGENILLAAASHEHSVKFENIKGTFWFCFCPPPPLSHLIYIYMQMFLVKM